MAALSSFYDMNNVSLLDLYEKRTEKTITTGILDNFSILEGGKSKNIRISKFKTRNQSKPSNSSSNNILSLHEIEDFKKSHRSCNENNIKIDDLFINSTSMDKKLTNLSNGKRKSLK